MYLPFVMYGYAAALALFLLGCRLVLRAMPGLRGIRELSWVIICAIAAVVLVGLRPWAPAWLTILIANCALFASFLLLYWTTTRVLGEKAAFLPWGIALCIAVLPPLCYATWIHPSLVARIVMSSGSIAILCAATAVVLFRHQSADLNYSTTTVAWLQIGSSVINVGRCILSILYPPRNFIQGDWVQTAFTYGQLIFCLATCCGIVWLSLTRHRAALESLALTDSMTGLLNRRAFDAILGREMRRASISGYALGLILIDLDWFKTINDTFGHFAGDEAIRRVSAILQRETRAADALARYGGEEFVVLLRDAVPEQAKSIAERLRTCIEQCAELPSKFRLTASIGVALSQHAESEAEFFDRCDKALYESKKSGRNVVPVWPGSFCESAHVH